MKQHRNGDPASSEQLEQLIQDANAVMDNGVRRVRLREIPIEVDQHFLAQAGPHRTLGEPRGGYELVLKRYPETVFWPKTPDNRLTAGRDALLQVRFDGKFADPDKSFVRVLYGVADTALDGAKPNYVAQRDLVNHYGITTTIFDIQGKSPDEPLTDDGLTLRGLLGAFSTLERKPDFSDVDFADALKVARTGEGLTSEEAAGIEIDSAERDLAAGMDREFGLLDVSTEEVTALQGVMRYLQELPPDAPEFSGRPLSPLA